MPAKKPRSPSRGPAAQPVEPRRGDVIGICCDPSVGVEPKKTRTCVVVSNDLASRDGAAVTVVPTQACTAERAGRAYMADLRRPRSPLEADPVANASMIRTCDRAWVVSRAGRVAPETVRRIDSALALHLGLEPP